MNESRVRRLIATTLLTLMPIQAVAGQGLQLAPAAATPRVASSTDLSFFGPRKYVRTTGAQDVYTATVKVPAWMKSPFRLHVQNGEPDGTFRVSSATVEINGVEILTRSDFNQNAAAYDRTVTAAPATTLNLKVTLASTPTSYLTMWLYGTSNDATVPVLTWIAPPNASTVNTTTPHLVVQYDDIAPATEPAASGVDLSSLVVLIDNVDRTRLFTRRSDEASADIPPDAPLAAGVHTFKASIKDLAGNPAEVTGSFRVDLTKPTVSFTAPAAGAYLPTRTPAVTLQYADDIALDLASLTVKVNGTALPSSAIIAGATQATVTVPSLAEGPNQVVAIIVDKGGNTATASVAFNVDVTQPTLTIAQPLDGARIGSRDVPVKLIFSDDQNVVPGSATAKVDGTTTITLTPAADSASGTMTALADGSHTLVATVADAAGNTKSATSTFVVDVTLPVITVVQPPAGANIKNAKPDVQVHYVDDQGVQTDTLKVTVDTTDQTSLFTKTPTDATATIPATLAEGSHSIAAEIKDVTGNLGTTTSGFVVDTIAPTGSIVQPIDRVTSATPLTVVQYADTGSGVDPESVALSLDNAEAVTTILVGGPVSASGNLPALTDGAHQIKVTFSDRAGNPTTLQKSFIVDTKAPVLAIVAPANNSFSKTTTPPLAVTYSDIAGTGIDVASVHLFLRKANEPETDVTSYVTVTATGASGTVPASAPLTDGTYHLRAVVRDLAGNVSTADAAFEVDTIAPTYVVESPAANGYVKTHQPKVTIRWADELSGVDTTRAAVFLDNADITSRFVFTADGGVSTPLAGDFLADGSHSLELVVFDRAGNQAPRVAQTFTVDTIAPTASITAPVNGTFIGAAPHVFTMTYGDGTGSGIDPASTRVTIDGTDRTAEFTITATSANATIAPPLADGSHTVTVTVLDWAANPASATSTFTVDSIKPVVAITAPVADAWVKDAAVTVTGTVTDASPTTIQVNGLPFVVTNGAFTASIPTTDGRFAINAIARDAAGNTGSATVTINVDTHAPVITVTEPLDNLVTKNASVHVAGTVVDASATTLKVEGNDVPLSSSAFATDVPLTAEGPRDLTLVATDAAGNIATKKVHVIHDTTAPVLTVGAPAANAVIGTLPVVLSGTVTDANAVTVKVDNVTATVNGSAWTASVGGLADGPHTFAIVATDAAGNSTPLSHDLTIDTTAPVVAITTPVAGSLTNLPNVTVTGTVTDLTLTTVKLGTVTGTIEAGTTPNEKKFTFPGIPLADGDNTLVVIATDGTGRTGQATVLITRDSIAPTVTLDAPDLITRTRATNVTATVEENLAIKDVVFALAGVQLVKLTAPPYTVAVIAPATSKPGDTLTLTVVATDTAGNGTTKSKTLTVTSDGALIGQVLSDLTGLPIRSARVRTATGEAETLTDDRGRYALPANQQNVVVVVDATGGAPMTTVERTVAIESGAGTLPVDARLTPLAATAQIGSTGGSIIAGNVTVTVPGGAVSVSTPARVTRLSAQGLPNLLPLGWSPVAAFDFRIEGTAVNVPFSAQVRQLQNIPLVFVEYSKTLHAWTVLQSVTPVSSAVTVTLPEQGSYALVAADDANVPAAVAGDPLKGVAMAAIPDSATSTGSVNPPTLPPTGGAATGTLAVQSTPALPSGTVVQSEVTETFSLTNGEQASEETRTQDIILYRRDDTAAPATNDVKASFPIVPSRTFTTGDLAEGKVHLDILAGRETVRGKTGGSQPLTLTSGDLTLSVPAGALPQDLAIAATPSILSSFLPSTTDAVPVSEVVLDFGGATLSTSAELSVSASTIAAGESLVIARVERVRGVPKVMVVAKTQLNGSRLVSAPLAGFAGIRRDGRYVIYKVRVPWGIIAGTISYPLAAGTAVVTTDGLPFAAIPDNTGAYALIAKIGTRTVTAVVPGSSLSGTANAAVAADTTTNLSFTLSATATTATITPADGTIKVPTSVQIEIEATAPLQSTSANSGTIQLRDAAGTQLPVRYVFSGSGRILAVIPQSALDAGKTYHVTVSGLMDVYGGAVSVAPVTFTTAVYEPPQYDTNKVVLSMPDSSGMITISAPAGSLPPGTRVIVVNSGNGTVVSFTVGNDGSLNGKLPATINDRLTVTITDPQGNVVSFERSSFVFNDGSGRVAIGPGGGTVTGPGGVELRIPDGALSNGAVFKVEAVGAEAFPEQPDLPGAHFGSGLKITSEDKPKLNKEGDLVFPRPADAPAGAFFYIYRRMTGPNGQVGYEVIDHAFDDGHGKIVTASYPFIGWNDSAAAWNASALGGEVGFGLASQNLYCMMWTWEALLPGLPLPGAIIGRTFRPVWKAGATEPEYEPVEGAMVRASAANTDIRTFARSQGDGTFALWDPKYRGGPVDVEAIGPNAGDYVQGTAFEANPANTKSNAFAAIEKLYGYAAEINFTFPAATQPKVSAVRTRVLKFDAQGKRQDAGGIVIAGNPLLVGFTFADQANQPYLQTVSIADQELPVKKDVTNDPLVLDYVLSETYTPQQPGTYTVKATALPPLGGSPLTISHTFLVVAAGGSNVSSIAGAPDVISDLVDPRPDSIGNATNVFPQITFTEPVKHIGGNVHLVDGDNVETQVTISGIGVDAQGNQSLIADVVAAGPDTTVTSITIQPRSELKFGMQYTVRLDSGIVDLDKKADGSPDPHALKDAPRNFVFSTAKPEVLGTSAQPFGSLANIALGNRVYSVENTSPHGKLRIFDIDNPATPVQVGETYLGGIPSHLAGEDESPITGGRVLAIPATLWLMNGPSNLWLYDASSDTPERFGAVSLTNSTEQGVSLRVAVKGRYAYAWTWPLGLQVIDMKTAQSAWARATADPNMRTRMFSDLITAGRGFGQEAIVNTIAVPGPNGGSAHLFGLKVGDYFMDGISQPLMIATGSYPLVVANPQTNALLKWETLTAANNMSLSWGWTLATARIGDKPLAIVGGRGTAKDGGEWVVAAIDLTNPRDPKLIGALKMATQPLDIVVKDNLALVTSGDNLIGVNLSDPANLTQAGIIPNMGGRLALAEGGIVISTSFNSVGGIRTAALSSYAVILSMSKITLDKQGRTEQELKIEYQIVSPPPNLKVGRLYIHEGNDLVATITLPDLTQGKHTLVVPAGLKFNPSGQIVTMKVTGQNGKQTALQRFPRYVLELGTRCSLPLYRPARPAKKKATLDRDAVQPTALSGDLIAPQTVLRGSAYATIQLDPLFTDGAEQVYLHGGTNDEWIHVNLTTASGIPQFTLPAELAASPGLVLVSMTAGVDDANPPLPLLVVDPTLPALRTAEDYGAFDATLVEDENGKPVKIRLTGMGFTQGMKVVLGTGTTPAFPMDTTFITTGTLEAQIPPPTLGRMNAGFFVAALAADRLTMSNPVLLEQIRWPLVEEEEEQPAQDPAATYRPDQVSLTSIDVTAPGLLTVTGVGLVEGGQVTFEVTDLDGTVHTETSVIENVTEVAPVTAAVTAPGRIATTDAQQPVTEKKGTIKAKVTPKKQTTAEIQAETDGGRIAVHSANANLEKFDEILIGFGGSYPFGVYKKKNTPESDTERFIFMQCDVDQTKYELVQNESSKIVVQEPAGAYKQLRKESDGDANKIYIRGVGLSRSLDDQPVDRALSWLTLSDNDKVTRKVRVYEALLGHDDTVESYPGTTDQRCLVVGQQHQYYVDCLVNKFADKYHLLPQVIKAQVRTESTGFGADYKNFRHEPSTIDLKLLSGDGRNTMSGTRRLITDVAPYSYYRIGGPYLPVTGEAQMREETFLPGATLKLALPAKRANGFAGILTLDKDTGLPSRYELKPAVFAWISRPTAPRRIDLTLIHCDSIWRRRHRSQLDNGDQPTGREFCVDYAARDLTLGTAIAANEVLHVRYTPVNATTNVIVAPPGELVTGQLDTIHGSKTSAEVLMDGSMVRGISYPPGKRMVTWHEGDSLAQHFVRNLQTMTDGAFLVPESDRNQEFHVTNGIPSEARDPKLQYATAQFWAGASYGPMQVTLQIWGPKMNAIFPATGSNKRNIIELLWNYPAGLEVGVAHDAELWSDPSDPNSRTLGEEWVRRLPVYNGGPTYGYDVFENLSRYEPF